MIESKAQTRIIPPGMHVKLIVLFRCNTFDEPEEMLVIRVQHGRSIVIRLHGYRDPPILKGKSIIMIIHASCLHSHEAIEI